MISILIDSRAYCVYILHLKLYVFLSGFLENATRVFRINQLRKIVLPQSLIIGEYVCW